jgi:transposase-like protein
MASTELKQLQKFKNKTPRQRMAAGVEMALAGEYNISEVAVLVGVNRSRLSVNVKKAREKLEEGQQRSRLAQEERKAAPAAPSEDGTLVLSETPTVRVENETRRVPPFEEFDRLYFSGLECFDCGVHHETPKFHLEMMQAITDPTIKRLMINMPPGHSKSTIGTVKSTVYELCKDPNSMTAIVSKSQKLAEKFLYSIAKYLTDPGLYADTPQNLIEDWGPFKSEGEPWSNNRLYIAGRQSAEKDPSVAAFGVGGHIYGIRAHRMIMDDVADLENQANVERVTEMLKWCTQEAGSRVGRHGKLIFIGTRVSAGDIYSQLQALPGYHVLRYPCILDEDTKDTLWPDHYPYEAADLQRNSMTSDQWQLVYQNVDTPGFGASFPPEVVEGVRDHERSFGHYDSNWALVAGLDLAGAGAQSGYTAMVLLGLDWRTGETHLVDYINVKQMKAPQLKEQILDWAEKFPQLRELRVEVNGLQAQIVQYDVEIMQRLAMKGIRVVPHITSHRNKWDPQFGVESMAPMFYNKVITTPAATVGDRNRLRVWEEQLTGFPMARHSDLVMATWFASLGVREMQQRAIAPMFDPRMKVPQRIAKRRSVFDFGEGKVLPPPDTRTQLGRPAFLAGQEPEMVKLVNMQGSVKVY